MDILGKRLQKPFRLRRDERASNTRRDPRRRSRHTFLAAQPHAHAEAASHIVGKDTMLQQTVARLRPLIRPDRMWTVTNAEQAAAVRAQLPAAARKRVLTEPVGRNTAAAIGLAAIHVRHATVATL